MTMQLRVALVPCLLLAIACAIGPDTTSGGGTSTGTTGAGTTGAGPTSAATTGSTTDAVPTGSGDGTGHASSGGPGGTSTSGPGETDTGAATGSDTTGAAACEAIVGSTDCAALVAVSPDLTLEECMTCQGAACGQEPVCDGQYPCVDGSIVLQGCCSDEQCAGLTLFCGMFIGTNNICVLDDDV
jgi:hypothetical protein